MRLDDRILILACSFTGFQSNHGIMGALAKSDCLRWYSGTVKTR